MSRTIKDYDRRQDGPPRWMKRALHHGYRARERVKMAHGDYDAIGFDRGDHHHNGRWDWF